MIKSTLAATLLAALTLSAAPIYANDWIVDTGEQLSGLALDLNNGKIVLQTNQTMVNQTALDPNRHVVDPGSWQQVNYKQWENGTLWHYTGSRWTSFGFPHSKITRRAVNQVGNGPLVISQQQTQIRSRPVNKTQQVKKAQQVGKPLQANKLQQSNKPLQLKQTQQVNKPLQANKLQQVKRPPVKSNVIKPSQASSKYSNW